MMTSEDEKPALRQFLRVQREDEEDTWISGEELKTEGSSGSDDDVPRRKITSRKSRRRRSEGYTPPEARFSLPNLGDNKTGIAFQLTQPSEAVIKPSEAEGEILKPERFSISGGELERANMDAAIARMRTRSSLDASPDLDECLRRESEWRPKRGSLKLPNVDEDSILCPYSSTNPKMEEEKRTTENPPSVPQMEKKKCIRFSDDIKKIEISEDLNSRKDANGGESEGCSTDEDIFQGMEVDDVGSLSESSSGYPEFDDECLSFLDNGDIDRKLLRNLEGANEYRNPKNRLSLPNFEEGNIDLSVKHFVSEMDDFYNEMSSKLKSLKNCPVLDHSASHSLEDPEDEKFMIEKNFNNLYKNLKKTPQMKKTLSMINKMDSDISDTISKFKEEKAERLDIQRKLIRKIPVDRESQLFLQLCTFEANCNDSQNKIRSNEKRNGKNGTRRKNSKSSEEKNFVERNIELARMGMNFPLSDEQKQRLEKLLIENDCSSPQIQSSDTEPPFTSDSNRLNVEEDIYQNCTLNAYRLSDDHKGRLIEIDSALQAFNEEQPRTISESNIGVDLVRSLKEIDEKLKAISKSYLHDEFLLEKNKKKYLDMNIDSTEGQILQGTGNNSNSDTSTSNNM